MKQDLIFYEEQEKQLVFPKFDRHDAWSLGVMLYQNSLAYGRGVGIEITINELVVFRYLPEGTTANTAAWLRRKHNMVTAKGMSSQRAQKIREADHKTLADWCMSPEEYAAAGGGYPLIVKGVGMIGSICASGLAASDDHILIADTIAEFLDLQNKRGTGE